MARRNLILLAVAAVLMVMPLFMSFKGPGIFGGSDDRASGEIERLRPNYRPWFQPIWEPPSAEIASLLFSLQAALGAGLLGYYIGVRRGQARRKTSVNDGPDGAIADAVEGDERH